jgi:hypothetical protein
MPNSLAIENPANPARSQEGRLCPRKPWTVFNIQRLESAPDERSLSAVARIVFLVQNEAIQRNNVFIRSLDNNVVLSNFHKYGFTGRSASVINEKYKNPTVPTSIPITKISFAFYIAFQFISVFHRANRVRKILRYDYLGWTPLPLQTVHFPLPWHIGQVLRIPSRPPPLQREHLPVPLQPLHSAIGFSPLTFYRFSTVMRGFSIPPPHSNVI